ncbi:MAG: helix-turn-helix transcriptional regulator, partial [Betaproteobacteria bacterium]|nr:helix-turn-helix transcriptional regulator [Betaproteobacteria bacterium]
MWKQVVIYGVLLAAGTLGLQWLDYQRLARVYSTEVYASILA